MSLSRILVLLTSVICLVRADDKPRASDRPKEALAAVAGRYYLGDGLGVNCSLVIEPEGRFSFTWRGCLGLYDENKGAAKLINGKLILKPEQPNVREGFFGTATDFIPVRWGKRLYLVSRDDKKSFCEEVNQGREPRDNIHGSFYLRRGDEKIEVTGAPSVPKDWQPLLSKKPLSGK